MKLPSREEFFYDLKNAIAIIAAYTISCLAIAIISNISLTVYTCMPTMKAAILADISKCYTTFSHFDITFVYLIFLALMLVFFPFIFLPYAILSTLAWKKTIKI